MLRIAWLGFHQEGLLALEDLLENGPRPVCVITLAAELRSERSGAVDLGPLCARHGTPLVEIRDVNDAETQTLLDRLDLDLLVVIGWHQIVRTPSLGCVRLGMVGTHASFLPHNRGSAPVNWALIRGETEGGNSMIWLAPNVDAGDIIGQEGFAITPYDTCATLYGKVAATNKALLRAFLDDVERGVVRRRPQPPGGEPLLPRRRPADGRIDWGWPARQVYDFVRALTRPYPGAFGYRGGERWFVWQAALLPAGASTARATASGTVLGPMVSSVPEACGQLTVCGDGGLVLLLELEDASGRVWRGPALSGLAHQGERWSDA